MLALAVHSHTKLRRTCRLREGFLFSAAGDELSGGLLMAFTPWSWSCCRPPAVAVSLCPALLSPSSPQHSVCPTAPLGADPPSKARPAQQPSCADRGQCCNSLPSPWLQEAFLRFCLCLKAGQLLFCGTQRGAALSHGCHSCSETADLC